MGEIEIHPDSSGVCVVTSIGNSTCELICTEIEKGCLGIIQTHVEHYTEANEAEVTNAECLDQPTQGAAINGN